MWIFTYAQEREREQSERESEGRHVRFSHAYFSSARMTRSRTRTSSRSCSRSLSRSRSRFFSRSRSHSPSSSPSPLPWCATMTFENVLQDVLKAGSFVEFAFSSATPDLHVAKSVRSSPGAAPVSRFDTRHSGMFVCGWLLAV